VQRTVPVCSKKALPNSQGALAPTPFIRTNGVGTNVPYELVIQTLLQTESVLREDEKNNLPV